MSRRKNVFLFAVIFLASFCAEASPLNSYFDTLKTKIILLGTGNPYPNPNRSGPATAIVYGDRFFLFDAGSGVERRINEANLPINGPEATFITHLHSDHTLGYPDLIFTSWIMRRNKPLQVYGPRGLKRMTNLIMKAWSEDIDLRINGLEKEQRKYLQVNVHQIKPGLIYDSAGIKITAIAVLHGTCKEAYGYRMDTPDRSIVISGDTRPSNDLLEASRGVDVLIHEVYSSEALKPENRPGGEYWPQYQKEFHTSDIELGEFADKSKPKLLILTHLGRNAANDSELIKGIRIGGFIGKIIVGNDLDIF